MKKKLPRSKMIRYCLSDIAKGLFNGMIGNYLLYFYQPTVKSGIPSLLPQNKFLGFLTVMALLTGLGKVMDAITDPWVANLSDRSTHKDGRRMPFMKAAAVPYAISVLMIFMAPFRQGSVANAVWVGIFLLIYYTVNQGSVRFMDNFLFTKSVPDNLLHLGIRKIIFNIKHTDMNINIIFLVVYYYFIVK